MALSNLTSYSQEEYDQLDIQPFSKPPRRSDSGTWPSEANSILDGWISNEVMAFRVVTIVANRSSASLFDNDSEVLIDIQDDSGIGANTLYLTVDTGQGNGRPDNWSVTFEAKKKKKKGKWVFAKGGDDDVPPTAEGSVFTRFWAWLRRLFNA